MLDDLDAGGSRDHGRHGRQVHGGRAIAARAHDIGGLARDLQRHGMRHHGLGGAAHLLGGQTQLLLGCEHRSHRSGIRIALHQIIDEPFGFLGAEVASANQFGQNRLP